MKIINQFMLDYPSRSKARGGTIYKIVFIILPVFFKGTSEFGSGGIWGFMEYGV